MKYHSKILKALAQYVGLAEEERLIMRGIYLRKLIERHIRHWRYAVPLLKAERIAL
jgi:hypothetical protein